MLKREDILRVEDLATEDVEVPEWGGSVRVRGMTAKEQSEYEQGLMIFRRSNPGALGFDVEPNLVNAKARLVCKCAIDEQGNRLFTDADASLLGKKAAKPVRRLSDTIERLSGMGKGVIDDLGKDSATIPEENSSSG